MCNMNQANGHLNNKGRLDTLDLTVDPTEGCLESIEVAVAEETAAAAAAGIAVEIAAAAAVAAAVELAVVERERHLELVRHQRWPWESFPCPFSL